MDVLDGRVAVITGGASGIGAASVRLFAEQGARVVIADISDDAGHHLANSLGPAAVYLRTDVSREADVTAAVALAESRFGRLDCMFNNAGISGPLGGIADTTADEFDRTVGVLLRGVFLGIRAAAPVLTRQRSGTIISTASVAGLQAGFGGHVYSAAKAAVVHLTRSVAMELGEHGVRVNCLCPGGVATPIFGKALGLSDEAATAVDRLTPLLAAIQPIPRACRPEDVAEAALWLASDAAGFVNGHALVVDGGMSLGRMWTASRQRRDQVLGALSQPPAAGGA
jgi:NAD(P)-dependent dehydrogenase (short-subunit alcohol dehydrogenase family)